MPTKTWINNKRLKKMEDMMRRNNTVETMAKHFHKSIPAMRSYIDKYTMGLNVLRAEGKRMGLPQVIAKSKRMPKIDWEPKLGLIQELINSGATQDALAQRFECNQSTIGIMLKKYKITREKQPVRKIKTWNEELHCYC